MYGFVRSCLFARFGYRTLHVRRQDVRGTRIEVDPLKPEASRRHGLSQTNPKF